MIQDKRRRRTSLTIAHVGDPQVLVIGIHEGDQSGGSVHTKASFFEELRVGVVVYYGLYRRLRHICQSFDTARKYFEYVTCNCMVERGGRFR
jgi:hypothetical protein